MRVTFISLFPDYFDNFAKHSIIKNAIREGKVTIDTVNPRNFVKEKENVDDYVYGGGAGMLMLIEPLVKAIESVKTDESYVVLLGPRGQKHNQKKAKKLSKVKHLILICGHYEGVDSRIKHFIDEELSVGDYILTGGEPAAVAVADSVIRLVDGVIKEESHQNESFENNLLEHDQFSKPVDFRGHKVPDVLLSGNHQEIAKWRKQNQIDVTAKVLLKKETKGE